MPNARLSAIVVTHDSRADIAACLVSLRRSSRPPDEILVIDNASRDGTADLVRRDFPDVVVLDYWDNPGFGEAHNRAFRVATGERFFLLNPDATVASDCIERLERAMDAEPGIGVAVPKVRLSREPHVLNSAGLDMNRIGYGWDRGYLEWDSGQLDEAGPVLAGSGCALMLSSAMVKAVGGFDPAYFLYYEDLDLCLRSWLAGFPVSYVPDALALHRMKVSGRDARYSDYLDHRNRLRVVLKSFPASLLLRALIRSARYDAACIARACRRGDGLAARRRVAAWAWNLLHLPDTLARRRRVRSQARDDSWTALLASGSGSPRLRAALPDYPEAYEESLDPQVLGPELRMGTGEAGLGLGWHTMETSGGVAYRWSCGYGIAFLRAPGAGPAVLRVACRALVGSAIRISVDGVRQGSLSVASGALQERSLPVRCAGPVARIELFPEAVLVPAEAHSGSCDWRTLGLAVASLRLDTL